MPLNGCHCHTCAVCELHVASLRQDREYLHDLSSRQARELGAAREELSIATRRVERLEADKARLIDDVIALEARTPNLEQLVADATEVLTHEIAVKLGIALTPERARDLARNVVQAQAGTLEAA